MDLRDSLLRPPSIADLSPFSYWDFNILSILSKLGCKASDYACSFLALDYLDCAESCLFLGAVSGGISLTVNPLAC
jgi:hypothetical protein